MFPDQVPGARLREGTPTDAPDHIEPLDLSDDMEPWHDWLGPSPGPFYFRLDDDLMRVEDIQQLASMGDIWIDACPGSMEDILDIAFSGAAMVVADMGVVPDEDLEETCDATDGGILLAIGAEHQDRMDEAIQWARDHEVPLLLREGVPDDQIPDDVTWYQPDGQGLVKRGGPEQEEPDSDDDEDAEE